MATPKIKLVIISIFTLLLISIIIFFLTISFNDQNSFLNIFESKTLKFLKKNQFDVKETGNYKIINFDNKVSSKNLLTLIYFLKDLKVKNIIIDLNFDNIYETEFINEIKSHIKENSIYGVFAVNKLNKSFSLTNNNSNDNSLYLNSMFLNNKDNLYYSNYSNNSAFKNLLFISPEKIGFINNRNQIFDRNNIDVFFKINNKYMFNLALLLNLYDLNLDLKKIELEEVKIKNFSKNLFFDQKGKSAFIQNIRSDYNYTVYNITEWEPSFNSRNTCLSILKELKILNAKETNYKNYSEENTFVDNIYNIPEIKNEENNNKLTKAKNETTKWKGFKNSFADKFDNSTIFITQNNNISWINNFLYQKNILSSGLNLKKISLDLIILISILLFLLISGLMFIIKNKYFSIIILFFSTMFLLYFYLFFRITLNTDFPFITLLISITLGLATGLILNIMNDEFWIKEVRSIYKGSISQKFTKEISLFWRKNNWSLESKPYLCTFLLIDTSCFLQKDISETDLDIIGQKNSDIESLIKNNRGIRNNFTAKEISAYFGNPPILSEHAATAIKTAYEIQKSSSEITTDKKIIQALHSKEEWFKFVKKGNQKLYTYFGNSISILSSMLQYAKELNVSIIISETIYKLCKLNLPVRMLDRVKISGITGTLRLFELLNKDEYDTNKPFYDYFHAGLKLYENKNWKEASSYFRQCLKLNEKDQSSKMFLERCKKNNSISISSDWDAIYLIK